MWIQSEHFSYWQAFFEQLQPTCSCIYWYLTSLLFKVYTKGGCKLTLAYKNVLVYSTVVPYSGTVHVNGSVHAKSGGHWSLPFLYKSSMHKLVTKTMRSLTTEIVNESFFSVHASCFAMCAAALPMSCCCATHVALSMPYCFTCHVVCQFHATLQLLCCLLLSPI